jgi:hypothetical protein
MWNLFLVDVALSTAASETSRAEQSRVARNVAVRFAIVFRVLTGNQSSATLLASQAGTVPVLSERTFPLGEVDGFLAFRADGHFELEADELQESETRCPDIFFS